MDGDVRSVATGRLGSVRGEFARWRRSRGRGERIPGALWEAACELAREHGVSRTSRALGLDYYALQKRARLGASAGANGGFVEIALPAVPALSPAAAPPQYRLELSDGRGARLRIELSGSARSDVEALARALWSAAR